MAPFEVLYGRKCRTPLNWSKTGERPFFGPDVINEAEEKVRVIRENLKIAQSRQKATTTSIIRRFIMKLVTKPISESLPSEAFVVSESRENWPLVLLFPSPF